MQTEEKIKVNWIVLYEKFKMFFFTFVIRFLRAPKKEAVFDSDCLLTTWKSAQNKAQIGKMLT